MSTKCSRIQKFSLTCECISSETNAVRGIAICSSACVGLALSVSLERRGQGLFDLLCCRRHIDNSTLLYYSERYEFGTFIATHTSVPSGEVIFDKWIIL